jgi:hypothetical protein
MRSDAEKRIEGIKAGLQSFVFSLLSLVPILGLGFTVAAVVQGRRAMSLAGTDWNPAQGYLRAARFLTVLGFFVSVGFLAFVCLILPAMVQDMASNSSGSS